MLREATGLEQWPCDWEMDAPSVLDSGSCWTRRVDLTLRLSIVVVVVVVVVVVIVVVLHQQMAINT